MGPSARSATSPTSLAVPHDKGADAFRPWSEALGIRKGQRIWSRSREAPGTAKGQVVKRAYQKDSARALFYPTNTDVLRSEELPVSRLELGS